MDTPKPTEPLPLHKSHKLSNVCYDIRGPVMEDARRLEDEGHRILKLNIGNPAPFGFEAPEEILQDVMRNLPTAQGYCDSKGLYSARKAIMQDCQRKEIPGVGVEDIYIGNGVSELVTIALQALVNDGDEVLIPAPDYPLWTAATHLSGGRAVHYLCDEQADWAPDMDDIRRKVTAHTRAIVLINPNNPTGAVYPPEVVRELLAIARENDLVVFSDEIYDRILYDDATHTATGALADDDQLVITMNGLSKSYRCAGFRSGWMTLSGTRAKQRAEDFIQGLTMLASMRLCANVPAQHAIQTALGGYQSINDLVLPGGRLRAQRDITHEKLNAIPGVSCVKPRGALYAFPRLDPDVFNIRDDERMVQDLLRQEKILLVQGTAFNWPDPDHVRIVTLPWADQLGDALDRFANFLSRYRQ